MVLALFATLCPPCLQTDTPRPLRYHGRLSQPGTHKGSRTFSTSVAYSTARDLADAFAGEAAAVGRQFDAGRMDAKTFEFRVESPWPEVARESGVSGKPPKVERGTTSRLALSIANHSLRKGRCTVTFQWPKNVALEPASVALDIPGGDTARHTVGIALEPDVRIGDLKIFYAITGDEPALHQTGSVFLQVEAQMISGAAARVSALPTHRFLLMVFYGRIAQAVPFPSSGEPALDQERR